MSLCDLREMLPAECGETLDFERIKPIHKQVAETQTQTAADAEKSKEEAVIQIGMEMDIFEVNLQNKDGRDEYTITAQILRQALEMAYDAGIKAAS